MREKTERSPDGITLQHFWCVDHTPTNWAAQLGLVLSLRRNEDPDTATRRRGAGRVPGAGRRLGDGRAKDPAGARREA